MSETIAHLKLLQKTDGIPITVRRGNRSCELVAVPSMSKASLVGDNGSFTEIAVEDWIIVRADWLLTNPACPQRGDLITVGASTKYFVAHPDEKTPLFSNFNLLDRPALAWIVHSVPQ